MKIIVQIKPDPFEKILSDISDEQMEMYEVDSEIYDYFLDEIFAKQFQKFVEEKTGKSREEIIGYTSDDDNDAKRVEAIFDWQDKTSQYLKEFHSKREKFYFYQESIYSYIFVSYANVGNIIEIIKYETEELLPFLNQSDKSLFKKLFKK